MNTDRTATNLVTVADNVVSIRQSRTRVGVESIHELGLRGGERVVHSSPRGVTQSHVTGLSSLSRRLEHGSVNNPYEGPLAVLNQAGTVTNLNTSSTQQRTGSLSLTSSEEDAVAGLRTGSLSQASTLSVSNVLSHRTGQLAILLNEDISQALSATLLSPLLPSIQGTARLRSTTGHHNSTHVRSLENAESGVLEVLGQLSQLQAEAQVRLIRTVLLHRILVGHALNRAGNLHINQVPHSLNDALAQLNDVFLINERSLNVQLSELRLTVRAEILVTVAASNLVVLLNTAHLQQLLEQLRGLRQSIPRTRSQTSRHQEVTRTLRGGTGQGRGLNLNVAVLSQQVACRTVRVRAQAHDASRLRAAKIQVAVAQARLLTHLNVLINLERQRSGSVQHLNGGHLNLNLASRQVRVLITLRALSHQTGHAQHVLVAQVLKISLIVENTLGDTLTVTQVNEGDTTVVAAASHPTGQGNSLSNICGGQLAVGVSAKHRHSFHSGHLTTIDSSRVHAVDDMRTLRAPHILYPLRAGRGQKKGCGGRSEDAEVMRRAAVLVMSYGFQ